ncbi:MAG: hypothetical protein KDG54_19385 [Geminicoccaceae bacterium]|nr:hypothetical protein [Geminicoccaceae bacterium]
MIDNGIPQHIAQKCVSFSVDLLFADDMNSPTADVGAILVTAATCSPENRKRIHDLVIEIGESEMAKAQQVG